MWNNRIFKRNYNGATLYEIHETFYDKNGNVDGWTTDPDFGPSESVEDLIGNVTTMYLDAIKYREDILDYDTEEDICSQ